ncbi:TniQ family protein, partial [Salmonella enterica]
MRKGRSGGWPWGNGRRSRYCPDCLAESGGRWQLHWRLGCVFACTEHRCLLADTCPYCGTFQRPRRRPSGVLVPSPGRCPHPST